MGILFDEDEKDVEAIGKIIKVCLEDWNARFTPEERVILSLNEDGDSVRGIGNPVVAISRVGGELMSRMPEQADAFKRVATFLVMMCLNPFLTGRCEAPDGVFRTVLQGSNLRAFCVRFSVDALRVLFSPFEQENDDGEWVPVVWKGFASETVEEEFIASLKAFSDSGVANFRRGKLTYDEESLAATIISISLILRYNCEGFEPHPE